MIELLVLMAIAYAGARGVESMTGHSDRRHDTEAAREAVAKVAETGTPPATTAKTPGPTDPGGTFSAAAPRSASLGGKVAAPLAIAAETSTAMWMAVGEGFRERWPEIRAERRRQMAARAAKRKTEKAAAEAEEAARAAAEKAGPPPAYPPKPTTPPTIAPPTVTPTAPTPGINGPQPVMSWPGDGSARIPTQPTPDPGRHLTAVPDPAQNGDPMSSPSTLVPEIRTLDGLLNALTLFRAMCEMRAEEAMAIAVDDLALSNRLDQMETELADLDVDDKTRAEIDGLRETIHAQSQAAAQYGSAAKDAADLALATAQAAHKNHGGIAEAVQSSPIEVAAQAGYYNR